jgi:hypothetical protein
MYKKLLAENGGGDDGKGSVNDEFHTRILISIHHSFCCISSKCVLYF